MSIGYEGKTVDDLVAQLLEQGVPVLVDVRLTPPSRKPGLSKTKLSEALAAVGIGYVHHRALGNPKVVAVAFGLLVLPGRDPILRRSEWD